MAISKLNKKPAIFPSLLDTSTSELELKPQSIKPIEFSAASTSASLIIRLSGLVNLYISSESLLASESAKETISHNYEGNLLNQALDESMSLIDVCDNTRDLLHRFKERVRAIECASRLRQGTSNWGKEVADYISFRKKMMREEVRKMIKQTAAKKSGSMAMDIVGELNGVNWLVFRALLAFLSSSYRRKKWGIAARKSARSNDLNEIERVDMAVDEGMCDCNEATKALKELGNTIEKMEKTLDSLARRMIKIRVSMLNLVSK